MAHGFIEQRYLDDAQFSAEAVAENIKAIASLCKKGTCALLTVFPRGIQVNKDLMNKDLFRAYRDKPYVCAIAVVTDSTAMHMASKVYFTYHPQAFPTRIFEEEDDARQWLNEQLEGQKRK